MKREEIIYVDHSEVREGKFQALKPAMSELAKLVKDREARLIAYNVYFSDDGRKMTVVHIHNDSDSLAFHMKTAGPEFPRFADFVKLTGIDIYGKISRDLLEQLQKKVDMLGAGSVEVHDLHAGFTRLEAVSSQKP